MNSTIKLGISTASYFPNLMTEDCFAEIKKAGAETSEVFLESYHEYDDAFDEVLKKYQSVPVHSIHTISSQVEPEIISRHPRAVEGCLYWYKKACARGRTMGASCYTFHGPMRLRTGKGTHYVFDYDRIANGLNLMIEAGGEYGITLCYENVHYGFFNTPEYFEELKKRLPKLGACLDIKQSMQSGHGWKPFFEACKDRLKTIHVCDFDNFGNLKLPGRGTFDFAEFFNIIKGEGVEAAVLLEVYEGSYKNYAEIAESYQYLRSIYEN